MHLRHRFEDRKTLVQKLFQGFGAPRLREAAEDERPTGCDIDRIEARVEFTRIDAVYLVAQGNSERPAVLVIAPVMKTADDRAVAFVGCAHRIKAVGATVLESS